MIYIADNQPLTCDALTSYLTGQPLHFAHNKAELVEKIAHYSKMEQGSMRAQDSAYSLVILDFSLFDFSTPENFLIYVRRYPQMKWLLLSAEFTEGLIRLFGSEENVSFLTKDCSKQEMLQGIYTIQKGGRVVCPYVSEQLTNGFVRQENVHLTPTETAILSLIAQGLSAKAIANKRNSSVNTIVTHKKNIFRKIGVSTSYEATRYALRSGLADPVEYYI